MHLLWVGHLTITQQVVILAWHQQNGPYHLKKIDTSTGSVLFSVLVNGADVMLIVCGLCCLQ